MITLRGGGTFVSEICEEVLHCRGPSATVAFDVDEVDAVVPRDQGSSLSARTRQLTDAPKVKVTQLAQVRQGQGQATQCRAGQVQAAQLFQILERARGYSGQRVVGQIQVFQVVVVSCGYVIAEVDGCYGPDVVLLQV